jgi:hypothetical protein
MSENATTILVAKNGTSNGVCLGNLRTRLQIRHGDQSELLFGLVEAGGMEVLVSTSPSIGERSAYTTHPPFY